MFIEIARILRNSLFVNHIEAASEYDEMKLFTKSKSFRLWSHQASLL